MAAGIALLWSTGVMLSPFLDNILINIFNTKSGESLYHCGDGHLLWLDYQPVEIVFHSFPTHSPPGDAV